MKRRTPRQLVRLLSDLNYAARCTALRSAAASRELERTLNDKECEEALEIDDGQDASQDITLVRGAHRENLQ
ncbi:MULTISPECIES: hypothetical protein [Paraburkholderia]|uniref:Uncharacterized protein n=2 Tax=Paraburkholderia TaxID=1822464 RepID=A0A1I3SPL4_9BURK|nr:MULTISPECIES: hypothetical protein [Paraburkholderia]PCE26398.1 hypothetical protein BWP39_17915 [Paraburkholderia acidicola]SFJ59346.1 hypothetical protein SAMN05192543_108268 [Paraburkholderia megapolitana]